MNEFDINKFPEADKINSENLEAAIFEYEIALCYYLMLDAVRLGHREFTVRKLKCEFQVLKFLKEKGFNIKSSSVKRDAFVISWDFPSEDEMPQTVNQYYEDMMSEDELREHLKNKVNEIKPLEFD